MNMYIISNESPSIVNFSESMPNPLQKWFIDLTILFEIDTIHLTLSRGAFSEEIF